MYKVRGLPTCYSLKYAVAALAGCDDGRHTALGSLPCSIYLQGAF